MLRITELKCEYLENPIGIDDVKPRFSWILESDGENILQQAYECKVGGMWESGKVLSGQSNLVEYDGAPLQPCTQYHYQVRVWDNQGEESAWKEGTFETGLMGTEFSAAWIIARQDNPLIRKEFTLDKPVRSARIYATAYGLYELELNGKRVGDRYFTPGFTSYQKRIQYQTYDVTQQVSQGKNALGIMLAKGWCRGQIAWQGRENLFDAYAGAILQLRVTFEDGTEQVVGTDQSWKSYRSPVQKSGIYEGERYDANWEQDGWSFPGFDDSNWTEVSELNLPKNQIVPDAGEAVRVIDTIKPIALIQTPKGETVVDFGQNMVGFVEFTVSGKKGDEVVIWHAEVLDKEGNFYRENLRTAEEKVVYRLKGATQETYHPHFSFQGFRYIKIDSFPGEVKLEQFRGLVVHSDMERIGDFTCSDPLVNQLYNNALWGQKGNFLDIPTDCPQRDERLGWTGDAQVFIKAAAMNMNVARFFTKWLKDLAVDQEEDGGVPVVIPNVVSGPNAAAWADAAVICPWEIYRAYGDKRILENQYESMKKWVEYMHAQGDEEYLWKTQHWQYGDWLALDVKEGEYVGATSIDFIASAYYAYSTNILAKTAKVLGYEAEHQKYAQLYQNILHTFRKEFMTPNGRLSENTQTAHALALYFRLTEHPQKLADILAKKIEDNGNKLNTGFVGTPYLCHALSENGKSETAYSLLLQKQFPSWLYSVLKGATTIWEHWDGIKEDGSFWSTDMNSFNHYAFGSIVDWLYSVVAGIRYDEDQPGYQRIVIQPVPDKRLTFAQASIKTMYGLVKSRWEEKEGKIHYTVTVPCNTTAEFIFPDGRREELGSGTYSFVG